MDEVHSAIKSLECVNILQQVNVKEDTEAVPSGRGSGSGYVIKIKETDAAKNADGPIQDDSSGKILVWNIANLPSIPILFLKEGERVARPEMHPQHLKRERK